MDHMTGAHDNTAASASEVFFVFVLRARGDAMTHHEIGPPIVVCGLVKNARSFATLFVDQL